MRKNKLSNFSKEDMIEFNEQTKKTRGISGITFSDMIFDKEKREAVYKYYGDIYVETEEEKEIFRIMSSRRKKDSNSKE